MNLVLLTAEHLKNVCRFGQEALTCSFLVVGEGGYSCSKGTPVEAIIIQRRKSGSIQARGDNCKGKTGQVDSSEVRL